MSQNVVALFFDAARRVPDVPAFLSAREGRTTFSELRGRVEQFAGGLTAAGFQRGERAVFMLPMSVDLYVAVLGTLAVGGIATFVDPWVSIGAIARMAAGARPAAFIGGPKTHLLRLTSAVLRNVRITVTTAHPAAFLVARHRLDRMRGAVQVVDTRADDPALITYTTGSSGLPKGVNRTHAILAAQHAVIREEFPAMAGDVDVTTFPVFALSNLAAGITTIIPRVNLRRIDAARPDHLVDDLARFGATTAAASPPFFDRVARHAQATGRPAPPLRRIVTGGAPVRDDQLREWRRAWPQAEIVVAYGSSEAEPVAAIDATRRLDQAGARPGYCVGEPVHAIRARVVPIQAGPIQELRDVTMGAIGELLVAGPHVCRDYLGDAAAFAENKVRDAAGVVWHRMGDTGYFDDRGQFWLVGRVHSTIRRGGVNLHAQLIEAAARADDARIRRVAALGVPDAELEMRLVIVVESDHPEVERDVRARLAAARVDVMVDALVVTRRPLPVDPRHNSKIDYPRLRTLVERGRIR